MPNPTKSKFLLIGGPCVLESRATSLLIGRTLRDLCQELGWDYVFKASYDKANRTSISSPRGPGFNKGLKELVAIRRILKVPVLTDVHTAEEARLAGRVVDIIQIPAFLCRQTDLLLAAARTGKGVSVKKGQFLAPWDMKNVVDKARAAAREADLNEDNFLACERGVSFGYNNLVADMTSLAEMRHTGAPVVFDVTHSVQKPGGQGTSSGGAREMVPVLARAGVAAGVAGLFMETHPNPAQAWSDGPNAVPMKHMRALLESLVAIDKVVKQSPLLENHFSV
jgi:2-dehydro-3-deoxyphosphooctonate aldolase (KDO 8-P synthase)